MIRFMETEAEQDEREHKVLLELRPLSRARHCVRCQKLGVRIGRQEGELVVDVLCYWCFENAPYMFKASTVQDVYRNAINSGCHERIATRIAEVTGNFSWPRGS